MTLLTTRFLTLLMLLAAVLLGCQTAGPDKPHEPKSLASLQAHNKSLSSLGESLIEVFREEGYLSRRNNSTDFIFEKHGGTWNNIAYGGLLEGPVWIRVRVRLIPLEDSAIRLTADAFRIRDHGGLEEEDRLGIRTAPRYRELLQKAVRLAD